MRLSGPGPRSVTGPSGVRRNLSLDLISAIGLGVTAAVVGALLPSIARQGGLAPLGIALLAIAPFVGNLLSAFAGRIGPRSTAHFAALRILGAFALVALAAATHPAFTVAAALVFWLSISFSVPFQSRLWGSMYPAASRGRIIGVLGMGRAAAAGISAVVVGVVADLAGAPLAVAVAGGVGALCACAALGLRAPAAVEPRRYSAREAIRTLSSQPALKRLVLAQGLFGGGLIAASPLYALVYVDRLQLTLAEVGTVAVTGAVATTLSYVGWGTLVDRHGGPAALRLGSLLGAMSLAAYVVAPDIRVLWLAALASGLSGAAIDLGIQGSIQAHTRLEDRAAAMAGWNALTGARGVAVPLVASGLVQSGVVDLTTALALCLVPTLAGVVLFVRTGPSFRGVGGRVRRLPAIRTAERGLARLSSLPTR